MFHKDGRWKEFGLNDTETTYIPFWLFCIVWAVVSHGLVRLVYSDDVVTESLTGRVQEPANDENAKSGYYKLDSSLMKRKGVPRYIYVGASAPVEIGDD